MREVKRKLDEVIEQKNACKKLDEKKTEFENKLLQKSKELAHKLKDKTQDENELKRQFNSVWSLWVRELTADIKSIKDIDLEEEQIYVLQELGIEWCLIEGSRSNGRYKNISNVGSYSSYMIQKMFQDVLNKSQQPLDIRGQNKDTSKKESFFGNFFQQWLPFGSTAQQNVEHDLNSTYRYDQQHEIRSFINDIEKESLNAIKSKPVATRGCSQTYLQEVAKEVQTAVTNFGSQKKYTLKKEFTVDLCHFRTCCVK